MTSSAMVDEPVERRGRPARGVLLAVVERVHVVDRDRVAVAGRDVGDVAAVVVPGGGLGNGDVANGRCLVDAVAGALGDVIPVLGRPVVPVAGPLVNVGSSLI